MKNVIIAVLVVAVGGFGFLYVTKDKPANVVQNSNTTISQSTSDQPATKTSGKTLDLSGKGLRDISHDVLDDGSVTTFNVSGNNLTGALPAEIRKLTNLEVLIASNNKMTGMPAEIGQLSKLRIADFSNNDLSGLPLEIGNLSNLETLDLRGNPKISKYDIGLIQPKIPNAKILVD